LRVGILGGAFNPPHIGHLVCAQEALLKYELDSVIFVPAGQPPHREIEQDPGPDARRRMCELAIEGGVFAQAIRPPTVPDGTSRLRLAVMASHTRDELREAARALGRAALRAGFRPGAGVPAVAAREGVARPFDVETDVPRAA
jgi:nicotinamide mononucleotide adenylyltransferase